MKRRHVAVGLCSLILLGCAPVSGETAVVQRAATQASQVVTFANEGTTAIRAVTAPRIWITEPFADGVIIVATYEAEANGHLVDVSAVWYLRHQEPDWVFGGGATCTQLKGKPKPALEFLRGNSDTGGHRAYAGGFVHDPTIRQVAITYRIGNQDTREVVPVQHGGYVSAKLWAISVMQVDALDEQGNILYSEAASIKACPVQGVPEGATRHP